MIIQDRDESRRFFFDVWKKHQEAISLQPLEELVLGVILEHPEYHDLLNNEEKVVQQDFNPESGMTNPFLHMGMHITIREQIACDRPAGISMLYQQLLPAFSTAHELEHCITECLGEVLWSAQRNKTLPDEAAYLECIKGIRRK